MNVICAERRLLASQSLKEWQPPTSLEQWQRKGHCDNQYIALRSPGSASVRQTNQPSAPDWRTRQDLITREECNEEGLTNSDTFSVCAFKGSH